MPSYKYLKNEPEVEEMKTLLLVLLLSACTDLDSHSVVHLRIDTGSFSGVFVAPGLIATVAHVAENQDGPIYVRYLDDNDDIQTISAAIVYINYNKDQMLLRVHIDGEPVEICKGRIGDPMSLWAWRENGPENTHGRIISYWKDIYYSKVDSEPGYSGGPVVVNGCVIGLHRGRTALKWSYARNLDWLKGKI